MDAFTECQYLITESTMNGQCTFSIQQKYIGNRRALL